MDTGDFSVHLRYSQNGDLLPRDQQKQVWERVHRLCVSLQNVSLPLSSLERLRKMSLIWLNYEYSVVNPVDLILIRTKLANIYVFD